jgi:hypothetical protein
MAIPFTTKQFGIHVSAEARKHFEWKKVIAGCVRIFAAPPKRHGTNGAASKSALPHRGMNGDTAVVAAAGH